ncbi:MAG: cell division protein FtsZ [Candidatus Babeliaceae bacterium]
MIDFDKEVQCAQVSHTIIKVVGVGGAGGNTINSMISHEYDNVEFIAANTDSQALNASKASLIIQLGSKSTKGLGAGANPDLGKRAAEEDLDVVCEHIKDADVVFLTGGLGGGTGSGALPVIAQALKERSTLTIAIVTLPFNFEGARRMAVAQKALKTLEGAVDTLIVIPNQKLLDLHEKKLSLVNAFSLVNNIINQCVKSIADIIRRPGHINVDFADVKSILKGKGFAVMGSGRASGDTKALDALKQAVSSPLLSHKGIAGARGILLNITGSSALDLSDIEVAASELHAQAHPDANIIIGLVFDESLQNDIAITIIATDFEQVQEKPEEKPIVTAPVTPVRENKITDIFFKHPVQEHVQENLAQEKSQVEEASAPELSAQAVQSAQPTQPSDDIEVPTILRRMIQEKQAQQKNN